MAQAHYGLGNALRKKGRLDEAAAAYRRAIDLKPAYAEAHNNLGNALIDQGRLDEALAACRKAIELKRDLMEAHFNLGDALTRKGRLDEALTAYRRAIDLKPDHAVAHCNLGVVFWKKGRLDEAAAAFRQAIGLKPDDASAHYNLGNVLIAKGPIDGAVAAYRRAIDLKDDLAEAHCNLGVALRRQGEFAAALAALKRGHELGSRRPDWPYPSAQWVKECRRLVELKDRLPTVLRGEAQPADAAERNEYALLCYDQRRYVAAARLWAGAFTADSQLDDDLKAGYRYDAACAAALAAAGRGTDASPLDDKERARWRKQALQWLRADLAENGKLLESSKSEDRRLVQQRLRRWQCDLGLASLRDQAAVAQLTAGEQEACKQIWAEVEALLVQATAAE
jgi:eukaryotic-like serine/threonine-protein kinase